MKAVEIIVVSLFVVSLSLQAELSCPLRIVKGDSRNHGQDMEMIQQDYQRRMVQTQDAMMHTPGIGTLTLPPRVLVIMTQFNDFTFSTTKEHADSLFNAVTPLYTQINDSTILPHGSVATYFEDQSSGQYRPKFDIIGPVTINYSYKDFPGSGNGASLAAKACTAVNDSVDFTQYDSDQDGYIDLVFLFYAGFGQNDKTYIDSAFEIDVNKLIWPHYGSNGSGTYDGKKLRAFECSNELDGYFSKSNPKFIVPAGSGILVHEFSHGMGLPDVYLNTTQYMGTWDLMDYGCYNGGTFIPSSYNGYQRWFCGWSKPKMMNTAKNDTLRPISISGDFGVIATSGSVTGPHNDDTEYWIVENHQGLGWDIGAYGEGLILYRMKHHNAWKTSANAGGANGCILLPADGVLRYQENNNWFVGKQGDCYPYGDLDSIKVAPNYPITAITQESNGDITLKVCGGTPQPTGIENLEAIKQQGEQAEKLYFNGTLYIRRGYKLYTITGNEINIL